LFGHRPRLTTRVRAHPTPFVPHQPHRTPEHRQIHQHHRPLAFGPHPSPAARTRRPLSVSAHMHPQRSVGLVVDAEQLNIAQSHQQLTHAYRVTHHRDPPVSDLVNSTDSGGSPAHNRGHPTTPTPTSNAKSRFHQPHQPRRPRITDNTTPQPTRANPPPPSLREEPTVALRPVREPKALVQRLWICNGGFDSSIDSSISRLIEIT